MAAVSLSGSDTLQIDGRILNDFADGDQAMLDFPNDLAAVKVGKNGNTVFAFNNMGRMGELKLRILLGSDDDKYLNSRLSEMFNDFSNFVLVSGAFSKRVGDGASNISTDVYSLNSGVFKRNVNAKTNAEGDTDQSVAEYTIVFGDVRKSVQ